MSLLFSNFLSKTAISKLFIALIVVAITFSYAYLAANAIVNAKCDNAHAEIHAPDTDPAPSAELIAF